MTLEVAAAAVVRHGRVLAARRVGPADVAGGWELPGGKVDVGETVEDAIVREVREELGCEVVVVSSLAGRVAIKTGYELTVHVVAVVSGEPTPREHDAIRWLGPEELDDVSWLPGDRPFLPELRTLLLDGHRLEGGNVGGAVRVGPTVRRAAGPWSPAVHALLRHLRAAGVDGVPEVQGVDERGREVLTYLAGRVPDVDVEVTSDAVLASAMRWLRRYHDAVDGVVIDGPWRTTDRELAPGELICHHDFAPYNVAVDGVGAEERVVGVFDWDMAGPGTRLEDLAFAGWNWVPLHGGQVSAPLRPRHAASRLRLMAQAYGGGVTAQGIALGVMPRVERALQLILAGQAAGDPGMLNLAKVGEPDRTARAVADLRSRLPAIQEALAAAASEDPTLST